MNSLKFIEDEIEALTYTIKKLREDFDLHWNYNHEDEAMECDCQIEEYEEILQTLQQIKTKLEAWEVIKRELELTVKEDDFAYYWLIYNPCELLEIEKQDYEIIKKALQVKNE